LIYFSRSDQKTKGYYRPCISSENKINGCIILVALVILITVKEVTPTNTNLPHQLKIDSTIPAVSGNSDYDAFRAELIDTDDLLIRSGIERGVIDFFLQTIQARRDEQRAEQGKRPRPMTSHQVARITDNRDYDRSSGACYMAG
jgi:hypothetical protein